MKFLKLCKNCATEFEIADEDLAFYDKISPVFNGKKYPIPPPTLCTECREQRRWAFRNQNKLYKRKCDFSNEPMISLYSPDKPYKVYKEEIWWSDKWDPLSYGRDFDFSRGFFEQFSDLLHAVPRRGMHQDGTNENGVYTTFGMSNKNCYYSFTCFFCEDVFYSTYCRQSKNCDDCLVCCGSELLYECTDCNQCYNCNFCDNCENCMDSFLLDDCRDCSNCIACKNLRKKQYHIYNKPVSKEEFEKLVPRIIEHIRRTAGPDALRGRGGELIENGADWGEFFPMEISPFKYEETVAQDYFFTPPPPESFSSSVPAHAFSAM